MEQKINIMKCLLELIAEVLRAMSECGDLTDEIMSRAMYEDAARAWSYTTGLVSGCKIIAHNMEKSHVTDTFQEYIGIWEEELKELNRKRVLEGRGYGQSQLPTT